MKTLTIIIAFVLTCANAATPNDEYIKDMQKCISELYRNAGEIKLQETINTLERIAAAQSRQWEPQYYIAFGYILMAVQADGAATKDRLLDKAMNAVTKAKALDLSNSEIFALEGFVHMLRVAVDPPTRGPETSPKAMEAIGMALKLDGENPRALALLARMQYGIAEFFGSPTTDACESARRALEKFNTAKPSAPLAPAWGRTMTESLLSQCN